MNMVQLPYEGYYIREDGTIISKKKGKEIIIKIQNRGTTYCSIYINHKPVKVHYPTLVGRYLYGINEPCLLTFKDGDKFNVSLENMVFTRIKVAKVVGYDGYYVSEDGKLYDCRGIILRELIITTGQHRFADNTHHQIKELVYNAFHKEGYVRAVCIEHIDGDTNNNALSNLRLKQNVGEDIADSTYIKRTVFYKKSDNMVESKLYKGYYAKKTGEVYYTNNDGSLCLVRKTSKRVVQSKILCAKVVYSAFSDDDIKDIKFGTIEFKDGNPLNRAFDNLVLKVRKTTNHVKRYIKFQHKLTGEYKCFISVQSAYAYFVNELGFSYTINTFRSRLATNNLDYYDVISTNVRDFEERCRLVLKRKLNGEVFEFQSIYAGYLFLGKYYGFSYTTSIFYKHVYRNTLNGFEVLYLQISKTKEAK